jgi:hypothetical protein
MKRKQPDIDTSITNLNECLRQIEEIRARRLVEITRTENQKRLQIAAPSPTAKASGMYWLYTDYTDTEIEGCSNLPARDKKAMKGAIPIAQLALMHRSLLHVAPRKETEQFRVVYNGIAGLTLGVRGRIHQHFNGGDGTGCLNILNTTLGDLTRWRISYVLFDANGNHGLKIDYAKHGKHLERMWRLTFGWPLLCRH